LEIAEKNYVDVNIHDAANAAKLETLAQLPDSCAASADCLEKQRSVFEEHDVFSAAMIDGIIKQLRSYNDRTLRADISNDQDEIARLVQTYFHCG
jgi:glutamine synthetase